MISYFYIDSIAKMLTARPDVKFKKSFEIIKMARLSKILMSAEIMLMLRDIKLKET